MGPYDEAAEIIGINRRAVDRLVNKRILPLASVGTKAFLEAAADYAAGADIKEAFDNPRQDARQQILETKYISTYDQLFKMLDINEKCYAVKKGTVNYWGSPGSGKIQLKATIERVENFDEELITEIFKDLKPPKKFSKPKYVEADGDYMLKINIFDLHYGKLCWAGETGENFDIKIAEKRFMGAIEQFIDDIKGKQVKQILFPIGNDFFNSDTFQGTTTAGTPQQDDVRWQKSYHGGLELLIRAIELLRQHVGHVTCYNIPGNHDRCKSYYATLHLNAYYRLCPEVTVDTAPTKHKAHQFGVNAIFDTHGDRVKIQDVMNKCILLYGVLQVIVSCI